ncbi:hypothetical protein TNCT_419201 [Trichonephila clavata]|uniref:Uncharacterized protein n=1 Tax=Trichonephila clavata TaxID=2740835 RepID=A0A8X6FIQ6_TRICU|nr:hypothetical protein TNCT_419201 [Trichonephila clavata]
MVRRRPYLVGIVVAILINSSRSLKVSWTAGDFYWLKRSSPGSVVGEEAWGEFLEVLGLDCCCGVVVFLRLSQKLVFGGAGELNTVATFFGVTIFFLFSSDQVFTCALNSSGAACAEFAVVKEALASKALWWAIFGSEGFYGYFHVADIVGFEYFLVCFGLLHIDEEEGHGFPGPFTGHDVAFFYCDVLGC